MKNKRGFLLGEETVKIIIAVICLVALVYFLVSLYIANQDKDLQLAKASLEKLINDANAGRVETEIYNPKGSLLNSPQGWGIVSFSSSEQKPEFCINKGWNKCMCICVFPAGAVHTFLQSCTSRGVCQESDFSIQGEEQLIIKWQTSVIKIEPPLLLSINQNSKEITKRG